MYCLKLHLSLAGKKPEKTIEGDWNLLNIQELDVIRVTLSKNVAHNVAREKLTLDLIIVLSDMYEKLRVFFFMKNLIILR